ncbi:MAG: M67 family metallopeptidase [Chloroflexi bacterium]|nr:M67 family metallopeptidase [Chloroflexota bacterium]
MLVTQMQLAQLIAQAQRDAPNETCGIIGGTEGRALGIFPLTNTDPTPRVRYNADPHELLAAFRAMDDQGWEHLAIYHSHPASEAYPSGVDVARAFYPDVVYILITLMNPEQPHVRAFRIVAGAISEITLEVKDESS